MQSPLQVDMVVNGSSQLEKFDIYNAGGGITSSHHIHQISFDILTIVTSATSSASTKLYIATLRQPTLQPHA